MELKDWVRHARKHKGMTMAQLAEAIGRSKSNVGLWEAGNHSPSYAQVLQIAAETGFPLPNEVEVDGDGNPRTVRAPGDAFRGRPVPVFGEATIVDSAFNWDLHASRGQLKGITAEDAYAIRIKGDGGHPLIKHHQFVVVAEDGRPAFGDLCIVDIDMHGTRLLEFLSEQEDVWTFMTLQGQRVTLEKGDVEKLKPVIAIASQRLWQPEYTR